MADEMKVAMGAIAFFAIMARVVSAYVRWRKAVR